MTVYVVADVKRDDFPNTVWELAGVFSTPELAAAACRAANFCVMPIELDVPAPVEPVQIGYYPLGPTPLTPSIDASAPRWAGRMNGRPNTMNQKEIEISRIEAALDKIGPLFLDSPGLFAMIDGRLTRLIFRDAQSTPTSL